MTNASTPADTGAPSTIEAWLSALGMSRYAEAFSANDIDLSLLPDIGEQALKDLGVGSVGHRVRLLKAISQLRPAPSASPPPAPGQGGAALRYLAGELEGERRQLTVLFCDMVGFTELASRLDPELLQKVIQAYEDACAACIVRYDGYVFQRLGDGIVAFFGYPLAHEGEAERAIYAGLAITESLAALEVDEVGRLEVRIGIATGVVVVSSVGRSAVGETMNLAARLQGVASTGALVVSERVRQLAGGRFVYENLGQPPLKGIQRPTTAYRVVGVSDISSRFEIATQVGLTALVGREQEISLLTDRWQQARGGEGQVVLLSGEPGIGKSRILDALRERLEADGANVFRVQCSPYFANSAFFPAVDSFERALKFAREDAVEGRLDKLEALIVGQAGLPREDVRYFAAMLAIPFEDRYGPGNMGPQRFKDETLRCLADYFEAMARRQPTVMFFEDVHWADPSSLEALDVLIERLNGFPLLVVLTHRSEFRSRWDSHGHVATLSISKLTKAQSSAIVNKLTEGKALPGQLLDQILTRTDGIPLFVEELTKSILESGEIQAVGDRYEFVGASRQVNIPASLRDSLMARLDRHPSIKEIAQIGSVIGREFGYELIHALAPGTRDELDQALDKLTESGLASRRGTPPDAVFTFKHALVQDAAYDSLLKSRRQQLHDRVVGAIEARHPTLRETEPEVLARHLSIAGQTRVAMGLWRRAAELAMRRMSLAESIAHLNKALEELALLPPDPERDVVELDLHASLGTVFMLAKGWAAPEVESAFRRARDLSASTGGADSAVRALWGICVFHLVRGEIDHARTIGDRLMELAIGSGSRRASLVAHMLCVQLAMYSGRFGEVGHHWATVEELYSEIDDPSLINDYSTDLRLTVRLHGAHVEWLLGRPDQAGKLCMDNNDMARSLAHPYSLSWALTWGAIPHLYRGDDERLKLFAGEGLDIAQEHGLAYTGAIGTMALGWAHGQVGRHAEGIEAMRRGLADFRATGAEIVVPYFKTLLAELLCAAGDKAPAHELLDTALEQVERWGERWQEAEIHRVRGLLWTCAPERDCARAEDHFRRAIDVASQQGARAWELRARTALARLLQQQGLAERARSVLEPLLSSFREGAQTRDLIEARAVLASL